MESWKSQRPPFFRLLLEGCKLSWGLAPRCLAILLPFYALSTGLNLFWRWFRLGEVGGTMALNETGADIDAFMDLSFGVLSSSLNWLGMATVAWITVRRMEGETPSPGDAFRRLGQAWRTVLVAGLLTALLILFPQSWKTGWFFLQSLDAEFLSITFGLLMAIAGVMALFYSFRMAFVATVPMVEGAGLIEAVKRSNFLVKGSTGYIFLLWCLFTLLSMPTMIFLFAFNSNFFEYINATVEATAAGEVPQVVLEMDSTVSPAAIAIQLFSLVPILYTTVTTAALYQHLRKLKSA